jgi:hypothetical protein
MSWAIRYDARGYGQTTIGTGDYSRSQDLHGLLQALRLSRITLLGCSQGCFSPGSGPVLMVLTFLTNNVVPVACGSLPYCGQRLEGKNCSDANAWQNLPYNRTSVFF